MSSFNDGGILREVTYKGVTFRIGDEITYPDIATRKPCRGVIKILHGAVEISPMAQVEQTMPPIKSQHVNQIIYVVVELARATKSKHRNEINDKKGSI